MKSLTRIEEQILLAIHHLGKNAYLITIRDKVLEFTGKKFSVGTIYVPLNRMNTNGYLTTEVGDKEKQTSGKPIKYYNLTKDGYNALGELRKVHDIMWQSNTTHLKVENS